MFFIQLFFSLLKYFLFYALKEYCPKITSSDFCMYEHLKSSIQLFLLKNKPPKKRETEEAGFASAGLPIGPFAGVESVQWDGVQRFWMTSQNPTNGVHRGDCCELQPGRAPRQLAQISQATDWPCALAAIGFALIQPGREQNGALKHGAATPLLLRTPEPLHERAVWFFSIRSHSQPWEQGLRELFGQSIGSDEPPECGNAPEKTERHRFLVDVDWEGRIVKQAKTDTMRRSQRTWRQISRKENIIKKTPHFLKTEVDKIPCLCPWVPLSVFLRPAYLQTNWPFFPHSL